MQFFSDLAYLPNKVLTISSNILFIIVKKLCFDVKILLFFVCVALAAACSYSQYCYGLWQAPPIICLQALENRIKYLI